jgi:hypothetical protein
MLRALVFTSAAFAAACSDSKLLRVNVCAVCAQFSNVPRLELHAATGLARVVVAALTEASAFGIETSAALRSIIDVVLVVVFS